MTFFASSSCVAPFSTPAYSTCRKHVSSTAAVRGVPSSANSADGDDA
jgi:hypothetical protein